MRHNKKGVAGIVGGIIFLVIATLLVVNLLIPQAHTMTQSTSTTDSVTAHTQGGGATSISLTQGSAVVENSLTMNGSLTLTNNYTVDYDAGTVTILNSTANGSYAPSYDYGTQYLEDSNQRTLAGVIVLAGIIGLLMLVFKIFGVL